MFKKSLTNFVGITRDLASLAVGPGGESEDGDQPDTDDSEPSILSKPRPAPVMGKGGLEQRGKKSRTYPPKVVQV